LLLSKYATGTSHGSAHPYDRNVPFSFLGPSVTAGDDYRTGVHTVDAVPTLLHQLGIEAAGLDGQALPLE
jgi:arylsulfatase A-like enzyme